ncbi:hypothetical protein B0H11DRAFT_1903421 [Mycena galericulata]|nr:hypothetical protein B0H11DRAFT_1903421 [Mycena galericulata]
METGVSLLTLEYDQIGTIRRYGATFSVPLKPFTRCVYYVDYFKQPRQAWKPDFFDDAAKTTGAELIAGAEGANIPDFLKNPYDALRLGVPFLNPILKWDRNDPTNRDKRSAKELGPPYVYNVFKGNKSGFLQVIKDAIANPINERYILPRMRTVAVEERVWNIIERDWKTEARALLKRRYKLREKPFEKSRPTFHSVGADNLTNTPCLANMQFPSPELRGMRGSTKCFVMIEVELDEATKNLVPGRSRVREAAVAHGIRDRFSGELKIVFAALVTQRSRPRNRSKDHC